MADIAVEKPGFPRVLKALAPAGLVAFAVAILLVCLWAAQPPHKSPDRALHRISRAFESNPVARAVLGDPVVVEGGSVGYAYVSLYARDAIVTCDLSVRGSRGSGRLQARMEWHGAPGHLMVLDLTTADGHRYDLLRTAKAR